MKISIKFYLKRKAVTTPTAIFARTYVNKHPFKFYIDKSIIPELWDSEAGRPISDKKIIARWKKKFPSIEIELRNIATRCNNVENHINTHLELNEASGTVATLDGLRKYLEDKLSLLRASPPRASLNVFIDQYIKELEVGKRLTERNTVFKPGTIKNYVGFQVQMNEYQQERHRDLDFRHINLDFYDDFVAFFLKKSYSPNSIGRLIKDRRAHV